MDWDVFWGAVNAWLSGPAGGLAAVLTAIIAIFAIGQTARDAREKAQPVVVAELRYAEEARSAIDLVVRNAGPTVARSVRVTFDPPLPEAAPKTDTTALIVERYREPIETLAPGQSLSNTWYFGTDANLLAIGEGNYTAIVSFKGRGWRRISEKYVLNSHVLRQGSSATSSDSFPGRMKTINESLKSIKDSVAQIARKSSK